MPRSENPRPELPLAIWCLGEVRNPVKLDDVGDALLAAICAQFSAEDLFYDHGFYEELAAAVYELGFQWPGRREVPFGSPLPLRNEWLGVRWTYFYAGVIQDRSITTEMARSHEWAVRAGAIRALLTMWPDQSTRTLLTERAPVDGGATAIAGESHSHFGAILFTRDLDGWYPYLDPTKPLAPDHIKKAAKKAGLPDEAVDEQVRSLSAHVGWDITKGSKAAPGSSRSVGLSSRFRYDASSFANQMHAYIAGGF